MSTTDGTRWTHKSVRYGSVEEALEATKRHYRRDCCELDDYVEVWLEKDALAGVLYRVTDEWGVPLMVTRGFASLSYIHNAAETIERVGKPTFIYYSTTTTRRASRSIATSSDACASSRPTPRSTSNAWRCGASRSRSTGCPLARPRGARTTATDSTRGTAWRSTRSRRPHCST